jgi:hypothetical protein
MTLDSTVLSMEEQTRTLSMFPTQLSCPKGIGSLPSFQTTAILLPLSVSFTLVLDH